MKDEYEKLTVKSTANRLKSTAKWQVTKQEQHVDSPCGWFHWHLNTTRFLYNFLYHTHLDSYQTPKWSKLSAGTECQKCTVFFFLSSSFVVLFSLLSLLLLLLCLFLLFIKFPFHLFFTHRTICLHYLHVCRTDQATDKYGTSSCNTPHRKTKTQV